MKTAPTDSPASAEEEAEQPIPLLRRAGAAVRRIEPRAVLVAMMAAYVLLFGTLTWRQQSNFGTFGFDMGIHDQGTWLLSRFKTPYVTIVGRNYIGHHANLIQLLFVPFYWLGAGPHFLYVVETVALALGAVPLWLLARDRFDNGWLALAIPGCYLLYPSLEWINWWHYHPDALIITPLLFAYWLATRHRWGWFWVAVALALAAKEDAALAIFVLGLLIARREHRRVGLWVAAAGAGWFAFTTKLLIPWANHGAPAFYEDFFPDFGKGMGEIAFNIVRHPSRVWHLATQSDRLTYYRQLLGPVAFAVPFLALPVLFIGVPQGFINVISAHGYTHEIRYHYSAIVLAAIWLATVEGIARVRGLGTRRFVVGLVGAASLTTNALWSPSPLGIDYHSGIWAHPSPRLDVVNAAVHMVPRSAGVSTTYYIAPHMTHRVHVYEWPNPFVRPAANWLDKDRQPDPDTADWLVLDTQLNGDFESLLARLTRSGGPFEVRFDAAGILVARRVRAGR